MGGEAERQAEQGVSDDPAARYYSPPPPRTLRERLARRKRLVVGTAAATGVLVVALVVIATLAGDSRNSGHVEAAFGGYVSPEDQQLLEQLSSLRAELTVDYFEIAKDLARHRAGALADDAERGHGAMVDAVTTAGRLDNGELRRTVLRTFVAHRDLFAAYVDLALYVREEGWSRSPRRQALLERAQRAAAAVRIAREAFYRQVAPYMTPAERRQFQAEERAAQARLEAIEPAQ